KALENDLKRNKAFFLRVAEDDRFDFESRVSSLHSVTKADPDAATKILQTWLPAMKSAERQTLTSRLSGSEEGCNMLITMYGKKLLTDESFNKSSADRIYNNDTKNPAGLAIVNGVKKRDEEAKKAFEGKLSRYV